MPRKPKAGLHTQGSLFEEDFLRRTLGDVVRVPDVALSELVANAWDAGASSVEISIPEAHSGFLQVVDDGCGLNEDSFRHRWMTLAFNRQRHQGTEAEFPPERADWRRRAYGRNGQGRHALLCFGDSYDVETWRDGRAFVFRVTASGGKEPFEAKKEREFDKNGHGTKVSVAVHRSLPDPDRIREVLSVKFLHDPQFKISVNGLSVPLAEHPGLLAERALDVGDQATLKLYCVEGEAKRSKHKGGIAYWVGGRLVGEPGWVVGRTQVLDGRTRPGRRLTFVIKTDDLFDEVLPDWTGFKKSELMVEVDAVVLEAVEDVLREVLSARVGETRNDVMARNRSRLSELSTLDQVEVAEMVEAVTHTNPLADSAMISTAVEGVIEAKKRRTPQALVERIMGMPIEDIEGLNRLLDEWTVRDALTVLDEIGRRIKIIEALEKVMDDQSVDELRVIHPLVTHARWLFGPEFESPTYASNVTIKTAVKKVFGNKMSPEAFENPKKRPDLLFLPDSTLSAVATEDIDLTTGVARLRTVLLIELKKGGSAISRKEMNQAEGYVEDLLNCGLLDGPPRVLSFVVGHSVSSKLTPIRRVGDPEIGRVEAVSMGQLVRTANIRLFRVREHVQERYPESGLGLFEWLEDRPEQLNLLGLVQQEPEVVPDVSEGTHQS
jgi:Histidine kinase-, DNA gyrase B-, and HSP90-like ATPase